MCLPILLAGERLEGWLVCDAGPAGGTGRTPGPQGMWRP